MADAPAVKVGPRTLTEAYTSLGLPPEKRPSHVINRRHGQVMVHLGLLDPAFKPRPVAIWSDGTHLKVLVTEGEFHPEVSPSSEYHLSDGTAQVFDLLVQINRTTLERIEDVDQAVAALERDPLNAPPLRVLELKRTVASVREELGRAIMGLAVLEEGGLLPLQGGVQSPLHTVEQEQLRLRDMTAATQTGLTDIFMIRQVDQANQMQLVANRMSAVSNRIAELANISNIRMLGLAYVMLILAVVSAIILFPNTAATIFGMATVYHAPDWLIAFTLVASTIIPAYYFFSQKWIRELFRGMKRYEAHVEEGFMKLTEDVPGAEVDFRALDERMPPTLGSSPKPRPGTGSHRK